MKRHWFHKWGPWLYNGEGPNYLDTRAYRVCTVCNKREDTIFARYL